MVSLDITLLYITVLFCVLMVFLDRVAFKPTIDLMEERRKRIDGRFEEASKMEKRCREMMEEYENSIRRAREEGLEKKAALVGEGKRIFDQQVSEERRRIGEIIPKKKEEIEKKLKEEMALLEKEMEGVGKAIAETLLGRSLR